MSTPINFRVKEFQPSKHAFKFKNSFKFSNLVPDLGLDLDSKVGDSAYGLCGGIVHCAHEMFLHKEPIPNMTREPGLSDPIYYYITEGLLDTFGSRLSNMRKMITYHKMKDGKDRLPKISLGQLGFLKLMIKQNRLAQMMIVYHTQGEDKVWNNHQVLAYGIEEKNGKGKIHVYDPNRLDANEIDKTTIEYSIVGKKVVMKQPDMNNATNEKPVHGFFLVNPPLRDPHQSIAYLASLGAFEMIRRMRTQLRKGLLEITRALKKYFKMANDKMIELLIRMRYKVQDIAVIMRKYYGMAAAAFFTAMRKAKAKIEDIVKAIRRVYRTAMTTVYKWLKAARVKIEDIAKMLRTAYTQTVQQMVNFLKRMKIKLLSMAKILRDVFRITAWRELGKILKNARYAIKEIIKYMRSIAKVGAGYLAKWLRHAFRYSASAITRFLHTIYRSSLKDIVEILYSWVRFGITTVINAVKNVFGVGKRQVLGIIAGF